MLRTRALTHRTRVDQSIFGMALRFSSNQPREHAHISLTALARSAQRTGFYERSLDALALGAALTILTGMTTAMHDLAVRLA